MEKNSISRKKKIHFFVFIKIKLVHSRNLKKNRAKKRKKSLEILCLQNYENFHFKSHNKWRIHPMFKT